MSPRQQVPACYAPAAMDAREASRRTAVSRFPLRLAGAVYLMASAGLITSCVSSARDELSDAEAGVPIALISEAGADVEVTFENPVRRGSNSFLVEFPNEGDGTRELVSAVAFMPAHAHGTAAGTVTELKEAYRVSDLDLFMPGRWDIQLNLLIDQSTDSASFAVEVE